MPGEIPDLQLGVTAQARSNRLEYRTRRYLSALRLGAIVAAVGAGSYLVLYLQTGVWQILAGAVGVGLGLLCLIPAYRLTRRGQLESAGHWGLLAVVLAFGVGDLVWSNAAPYALGGGLLLITLLGGVVRPRTWRIWFGVMGLYIAAVVLIERFEPVPRYDITQQPMLQVFVPAIIGLLLIALSWQIAATFRIGSIRTRLMILFILLAVLPITALGLAATILGARTVETSVVRQLDSIALLKESEVNDWVDQLNTNLRTALLGVDASRQAEALLTHAPGTPTYDAAYASLARHLDTFSAATQQFEELLVLDLRGQVVASTDRTQEHLFFPGTAFFREGLKGAYVQPPVYDFQLGRATMVTSRPVVGADGQTLGVLAGRASLDTLNALMTERTGLGDTGETYLMTSDRVLLTALRVAGFPVGDTRLASEGARRVVSEQERNQAVYANYRGAPVIGVYRWLPELKIGLLAEQELAEAYAPTVTTVLVIVINVLIWVTLAVLAATYATRSIGGPLIGLADTARRIAGGDLRLRAEVVREDEIGVVAHAFNAMTDQLRGLIDSLEARVDERTAQVRASADVGRAAASILDPELLAREVVNLITSRFGFYYAAVFTLDELGRFAVLREATGEAGRVLKERGHKLEVGGESMVGTAIQTRRARIALDVGEEPVRFANPLLPDTRSEIALPLAVGDHVLGALDVQSTQEAAFDETGAAVLQSMADQVAVALNNAESYAEAQSAVRRAHALYAASQQVGRMEADIDTVVRSMLRAAAEPLGFSQWWIVTFDQTHELLLPLSSSLATGRSRPIRVADQPDSPAVRSAVQGETHVINDPVNDPRLAGVPVERRAGIGKFVSVPILSHGQSIGALNLGRPIEAPDVGEADLEASRSMASLVALMFENRSLFEQTRRALSEVDAVNRRLTGEAWTTFSRRLGRSGVLWVGGESDPDRPEVREALASGHIAVHPAGQAGKLDVAVPIQLRGASIGALRLTVAESAWDDAMLTTLGSIAAHVAQAAENARLVETAEDRARRERALAESTDKIRRSADMERILQTAAEELARHLNASRIAVHLTPATEVAGGDGHTTPIA